MSRPNKCPYCEKDYLTDRMSFSPYNKDNKDFENCKLYVEICCFCKQPIIIVTDYDDTILCQYPATSVIDIPNEIQQISPQFKEIYSQAIIAKSQRLTHLVGSGLRKALEFLITDYLVYVQKANKSEVLKKTLADRIKMLDEHTYAAASANLIRLIGNDLIHYDNKYDVSDDELIKNMELTMILMASRIKSINAGKRLTELQQTKT